ncbi:MAG: TIGR02147 family protein [Bdellovibrionota bacterium]
MKLDLFEYSDYKNYLRDRLRIDNLETKGLKSKLCVHIGCQPSYLSQVLNGKPHFTLEQCTRLNGFFGHTKDESKYFLFMLEADRAGTKELQNFFNEQLLEIRQDRLNLKKRLHGTGDLPREVQHTYYSTWYYAAIHVMLSIPEFQDVSKIATSLHLPMNIVSGVIQFLEEIGLISFNKGTYVLTKKSFFLGRESEFIQRHHINWRSQALQSVEKNLAEDLHYSNVVAISKSDFHKIKEIFASAIEESRKVIGPSKEEALYALTLDAFRLWV